MKILLITFIYGLISLQGFSQETASGMDYQDQFDDLLNESLRFYNRKELDSLQYLLNQIDTTHSAYQEDSSFYFKRVFLETFVLVLENQYSQAMEKLLVSDRFYLSQKDSRMLALVNYQLGKTTYYMRNREKAKSYFEKSLEYQPDSTAYYAIKAEQYLITIELELLQLKKDQYQPAEYQELLKEIISDYESLLPYYHNHQKDYDYSQLCSLLASCYFGLNQFQKSLDILTQGEPYTEMSRSQETRAFALVKKVQILNALGDYATALQEIQPAKRIYRDINDLGMLIYAYDVEKSAMVGLNRYREAYALWDSIYSLTRTLYDVDMARKVEELEARYETEKKEQALLQARTDQATAELELSNKQLIIYLLIGGLLILFLLGLSIFQRNRRRYQLSLAQEKEARFRAVIEAEEKERSRIAKDLHDGIGQRLSALKMSLATYQKKQSNTGDEAHLAEIVEGFHRSANEVREISHKMMPRTLLEYGLIKATEELLSSCFKYTDIDPVFEHLDFDERLEEKLEIVVFRIIQELVTNILKHAEASTVKIQLIRLKHKINLVVEDNGKGRTGRSDGHGLLNINTRVEMLQGVVNYESAAQQGFTAMITIPM